jgi:hypothetical protein
LIEKRKEYDKIKKTKKTKKTKKVKKWINLLIY